VADPATRPAVLVIAPALAGSSAAGASRRRALLELLGPQRSEQLDGLLVSRAVAWGERLTAGRVQVSAESPAEAAARAFAAADAPVLVVWPVLPRWRPDHGAAALEDLATGCVVTVGPVFDGGLYLLGLAGPAPWLPGLVDPERDSTETISTIVTAANAAGQDVGLLRAERGLRSPQDVRAALADPLLDPELAAVLRDC
jgi:hypothetical protein